MMVMIASFSDKRVNSSEGPRPQYRPELPFPLIAPRVAFCSCSKWSGHPTTSPSDSSDHPEGNLNLSCHTASHPATQRSRLVSMRPWQCAQVLFPITTCSLLRSCTPCLAWIAPQSETKVPRADSTELSCTRVLSCARPGKGPHAVIWGSEEMCDRLFLLSSEQDPGPPHSRLQRSLGLETVEGARPRPRNTQQLTCLSTAPVARPALQASNTNSHRTRGPVLLTCLADENGVPYTGSSKARVSSSQRG